MKNIVSVVTSTYPKNNVLEALDGISKAGFKYVEMASAPSYFEHILPRPELSTEADAKNLLRLCEKYELELYAIAGHTRMMKEDTVKNFKKLIDFAKLCDVKFITTDAGEIKSDEDEKKFFKDINEIAEYAGANGITICLETHGNYCNNAKKGAEIIKKVNKNNLRLNYDTGNVMLYGGVKPEEDIQYALPYIAFIHLKDSGGKLFEWNFPALGSGKTNFKKIFSLLKDYSGPMSVEIEYEGKDHSLKEINADVKKSYDFLKSFGYVQ
ncbi:MAG: sugar phosphate isomerase/epimerase [Actinobacteria bacterium]|nr:sugar phosphate isomerase/epimerase [Cyanobacteriota bacterium]MCL5771624.1 sugar phosphate isomerase/epimerase [Actinomycetota bacterium]